MVVDDVESYIGVFVFLFFKQRTAYEMRISDWSSDVCSSDLIDFPLSVPAFELFLAGNRLGHRRDKLVSDENVNGVARRETGYVAGTMQIGRASCRERVCQYV